MTAQRAGQSAEAAQRSVWPCEDSTLHVHTKAPCSGWPYPSDHHRDLKYLPGATS